MIHIEYNMAQLYISVFDRAFILNASWNMLSNKSAVLNNNGEKRKKKLSNTRKTIYSEEV